MSLKDDLSNEVAYILRSRWQIRDGYVVPDTSSLTMANEAVVIEAAVLYADMSESTNLVDQKTREFAAEIYKSFLLCAAKVVRKHGGDITAYDGDRIMAVFLGDTKESDATKAALQLNWARQEIIQPAIKAQYTNSSYVLKHTAGIDVSDLFVARTGVRGANDLVWVGRAANHAAKLCTLSNDYPTRITKEVFDALDPDLRSSGGKDMWEARSWTAMNNRDIFRSNWRWRID